VAMSGLAVSVKAGRRWRTTAGVALNRGTPLAAGVLAHGPRVAVATSSHTSCSNLGGGGFRVHLLLAGREVVGCTTWSKSASAGAL
jgi:hypothetical protein